MRRGRGPQAGMTAPPLVAKRDAPVGGQAVLEGVMMRGVSTWAVAVRRPPSDEEKLGEIRGVLEADGRYDARFVVEIKDEEGGVVALVERVIYCATKTAHEERTKLRGGSG